MEMRMARVLGLGGLLVLVPMGCNKVSKDSSKVIANVAGEKITEKGFGDAVRGVVADEAKAKDLLTSETLRDQRNKVLEQLALQKALVKYAKGEGLDKDIKVQAVVEGAIANTYAQILIDRRISKAEPTEAQLKEFYDTIAKEPAQAGGLPPFEQIKGQLPAAWKRKEGQRATEALLAQVQAKYPTTFAPGYQPNKGQ